MKLGSSDISAVKIGSTDVSKVYIGSTEVWSSFTGLLDTYTGAAAAYSLRQLKSGITNAIEVRRASDNTTQDIGFVDGELDTTSLASFCSGTNGFVTTWYDQSGNGYDATQTTAASQPQIVSSGSVITENGKPTLVLDGSNDYFSTTYAPSLGTASAVDYYLTSVVKSNAQHIGRIYSSQPPSAPQSKIIHIRYENTQYRSFTRDSDNIALSALGGTTNLNQINFASLITDGSSNVYINSLSEVNASASFTGDLNSMSNFTIGALIQNSGNSDFLNANLQELIFYPSDQSSNRSGIETNINDFYTIY